MPSFSSRIWSLSMLAAAVAMAFTPLAVADDDTTPRITLNPYEQVDWDAFEHHKAALHVHTLQSDGRHKVREVVHAYRDAGFTILAITDHDTVGPNHVIDDEDIEEHGTSYPNEEPDNFPANPTWPWTDYGTESPSQLGMVGISGNELSRGHHMNSFFTPYGARSRKPEAEQIEQVRRTGGLVIFDHPGIDRHWWDRRHVDWYVEHFERFGPDVLVGLEVTNTADEAWETYDEGLWDQLLARFMPERPIWGFGTDDMHSFGGYRQSHTVFVLDELTSSAVRDAMRSGQFYFTKSTERISLTTVADEGAPFPQIERIEVDEQAGTITIDATGYDRIEWISMPASLEDLDDHETSKKPWALGEVVATGETLDFVNTPGIERFIRAQLHRDEDGERHRVFTNPFGISSH